MAKEIMISRNFLQGHPMAGEETFFVEKIWEALWIIGVKAPRLLEGLEIHKNNCIQRCYIPKLHTIRKGHRFKVGDKVILKVWSGKPYRSKKIAISPEIEIKKIYSFEIIGSDYILNDEILDLASLRVLAQNDGLSSDDFENWFNVDEFDGQVICWGDVNY